MPLPQAIEISNFSGGLNDKLQPFKLPDNFVVKSSNFRFNRRNALTKYPPLKTETVITGINTPDVKRLFEYTTDSAVYLLAMVKDIFSNLHLLQKAVGTPTFTDVVSFAAGTQAPNGTQFLNDFYYTPQTDSAHALGKLSGTVNSFITTAPIARHIVNHKSRIWLANILTTNGAFTANKSRIFWSDINAATFNALNFIDIDDKDGGEVTGMIPFLDSLIIFKQTSVWRLYGDSFDVNNPQFFLVKVVMPQGYGGIDGRASVNVGGNLLIFPSQDGFYAYNGESAQNITQNILDPTYRGLILDGSVPILGAYFTFNGLYYTVREQGQLNNNLVLYKDEANAWWRLDLALNDIVYVRTQNKLYAGALDRVFQMEEPDGNIANAASIETKDYNLALPSARKVFKYLLIRAKSTTLSASYTVSLSVDGGVTFPVSKTINLTQSSINRQQRVPIRMVGDQLRLKFSLPSDTNNLEIIGIAVYFQPARGQGGI